MNGLSTQACLRLLWDTHRQRPRAWNVIYGGSYDVNCMLRDLTPTQAWCLHKLQTPIELNHYEVSYQYGVFNLRHRLYARPIQLWDIVKFFQSTFVKALRKNLPNYDSQALQEIAQEKERRAQFRVQEFEQILHYCQQELKALTVLAYDLDKNLIEAGIGQLRALHGAGSIAGALLRKYDVQRHKDVHRSGRGKQIANNPMPRAVYQASYYAYAGGRAELWRYGNHKAKFYTHDRNSAYPFAMLSLPTLANGEWHRNRVYDSTCAFSVYRVRFDCRARTRRGYPFFLRVKTGHIYYPPCVTGWYWAPEIESALATGFADCIEITDGWQYTPSTDEKPFAFVPDVFAQRARLKAQGRDGAQYVLKLGLNSLYGKLAQTVGGELGRPPPYHQFAWAGWITSHTRAAVFKLAMQNPDATAFIATDGVGATETLTVSQSKALGDWTVHEWNAATLVQAGVYFLFGRCDNEDCEQCKAQTGDMIEHAKYRGFDPDSLHASSIVQAWKDKHSEIAIPSTRFITLGSALTSPEWFDRWCTWRTIQRDLNLWGGGGKRYNHNGDKPHYRLEYLSPTELLDVQHSARFPIKWLGEEWDEQNIDGVPETVYEAEVDV